MDSYTWRSQPPSTRCDMGAVSSRCSGVRWVQTCRASHSPGVSAGRYIESHTQVRLIVSRGNASTVAGSIAVLAPTRTAYMERRRRRALWGLVGLLALAVVVLLSLAVGPHPMDLQT